MKSPFPSNLRAICTIAIQLIISAHLVSAADDRADGASLFPSLPDDFEVIAVGTYSGTHTLDNVQLDDSGHTVKRADVTVNHADKPVFLVLMAYDPVVWSVARTEKTKIAGVLVSGYHGQALVGIEKTVPHKLASHEQRGPFRAFYAYQAGDELKEVLRTVKSLIGRDISKFVNKPQGTEFVVGEPPAADEKLIISDDLKLAQFARDDLPPAGQKGLDELVQAGAIRPAKQEDIDAWVESASAEFKKLNPDLKVETRMRVGWTYVVLKPFDMPAGLFGGHSRSFFIPTDGPIPRGDAGHCEFYFMDGTKEGPFERARRR